MFPDLSLDQEMKKDNLATVILTHVQSNELRYKAQTMNKQWLVFSEIYYQPGWQAYVNGEKVPHYNVNYVLRGLPLEPGKYDITFKFEPKEIEEGSRYVMLSYGLFFLLCLLLLARKNWGNFKAGA